MPSFPRTRTDRPYRLAMVSVTAVASAALTSTALVGTAFAVPGTGSPVLISEIHYDNDGTDSGEAIEVQAPAGTDLTGWSLVLYNGSNGAAYGTRTLTGVVGDSGVVVETYPPNGIQNGAPDAVALVDATGQVVQLLSYEGVLTASDGPAAGLASTDIGVAEPGNEPVGSSLQLVEGTWRAAAPSSFGALNTAAGPDPDPGPGPDPTPVGACGDPATAAYAVQGPGATTPLAGQSVTVEAVVVGDLQTGFDGFHVQDATGDGDPATSDGLVVHAPGAVDVALGDVVRVTGTAVEVFGQTQLGKAADDSGPASVSAVAVCSSGAALPPAAQIDFPVDAPADLEAFEGMRVEVADPLTVTEVFSLARFGEVVLSTDGVQLNPTEVVTPGPEAVELAALNARTRIVLDDGSSANLSGDGGAPPYLTREDPVRVGDAAALEPVVLGFGFGLYRLQPADGGADGTTFAPTNPRPAGPEDVGGDIQVAAFNVLNYFTTLVPEDSRARGAATAAAFDRQEAKIVAAISVLDADVVALAEIENSAALGEATDEALATLVAALNEAAGSTEWAFVPSPANLPPAADQDVITNAIIYRPTEVVRVGESVARTNEAVWFNAREPIAQTFAPADVDGDDVDGGDALTVVANHFKSKGARGATGDNLDTGDGQGAFNGDRTRQAADLVAFVEELVAATDDPDVMLLGDFNAYSQEDPIAVLADAGLVDLAARFAPGDYSYVFGGTAGSLDHALATGSLAAKVTDADIWNINSVESGAYQYDGVPALFAPDAYRASDHDPIVIGVDLAEPVPAVVTDLALDVESRDLTVRPGRPFDLDVTVANLGPGDASGITVTHVVALPAGVTLDRVQAPRGTSFEAGTLTWTVGVLEPGEEARLRIRLATARDSTGAVQVAATVAAPGVRDTLPANDTDGEVVTLAPRP